MVGYFMKNCIKCQVSNSAKPIAPCQNEHLGVYYTVYHKLFEMETLISLLVTLNAGQKLIVL